MASINFKHASGRVSFNAGMTSDGKLIKKTKTYRNVTDVATPEQLYTGLAALASLSAYTLIDVEKIETSVVNN